MPQALSLAAQALFISNPNPRVGCVLVNTQGQVIGQGFTQQAGGPHAEVMALRDAAAQGYDTRGATAYVTLEPCSHTGRTGPCCNALIDAGIAKVVGAITDPNPQVAGQGFAKLRAAGVQVEVDAAAGLASRELNLGFFSRMVRGTPWVRMKAATSLDGSTALHNSRSQWITGPDARADGHAWRARACAILTGIGTVLQDNPRLNVREVATPRQPKVVVVDSKLDMPLDAHVLKAASGCTIYTSITNPSKTEALQALGATVIALPNAHGKVDLSAMLLDLGARGTNELHVEAGFKLNGSLLREGLVDELLLYLAPQLLGTGGMGLANFGPLDELAQGVPLQWQDVSRIGNDLRIVARVAGRDQF
ncbi:bifunctional diaminohydroxyphosphoribosylaminopyrimidine deaminase/5-amino-6-(5-phosphoribosylamino)uracil reductase RibD [Comamonas aquatica]|uniref:bifunctional diaminohydroxyphosphoribosylaminopyrimidine deaminase/5-amino-6-(5-phosphoribosylamino)uracil reductase RibD n=1 Tax=Comamonas aquatica TaxID=225991 RepID=UPI00244A371A|nr:bifunctional diaminohydroxyphosphoribosylaminopyrimidine deaminase/5-amino-6-(5-phosphoribosylamino)uracil reductase RibD [Comamonas aquatica]MDH0380235.1 bifunctional diaminohydroxyphosphoribosylaminopyrimidine deaminase/5-amino-6-(5-phosphoribosylamino)uracil reductase RibD [Comamonas aquatica]MDH0428255.1 bifunctional diaminohydroxyphosphoribosylaminopyrimidine deaminase/5-amino-6-(5-phosphoribosylamino)uracil reductase RibD [Comamonas aquatica]MDH0940195.1 bifunctional diaminohydroxyphosp